MKPIATPADRLTADCIWNSFRSSGKRHLILTGARGSGKTTLLKRLFPDREPDLITRAVPRQAVYLHDSHAGKTVQVGVFDPSLPGPGNQMVPLQEGFESLGVSALNRCRNSPSPWAVIDEIGYLESRCEAYGDALRSLLEKKQLAAVVRSQDLPFLHELRSREDAFVVNLDDPFGRIGCVIMASGLGKRFGGDKLMADFRGQPMICRILDATEGIFARRIVVTRSEKAAMLCRARGIQTLLHDLPLRSDAVRLGMEAMEGMERCLFAVSDQPLLRRESVAALALAAANGTDCIWRAAFNDIHGSPVIFPRWTFAELVALPEGKGGGAIIKKYPERLRTVSVRDGDELRDVDSPADLQSLLER